LGGQNGARMEERRRRESHALDREFDVPLKEDKKKVNATEGVFAHTLKLKRTRSKGSGKWVIR